MILLRPGQTHPNPSLRQKIKINTQSVLVSIMTHLLFAGKTDFKVLFIDLIVQKVLCVTQEKKKRNNILNKEGHIKFRTLCPKKAKKRFKILTTSMSQITATN